MAMLNILHYPDSRLRRIAEPVATIDKSIQKLAEDMLDTMYEAPGVGLAAPQVNVTKQIIVIDITEDKSNPLIFINPEIIDRQGSAENEEGCLSIPNIFETVTRAEEITVRYLNQYGKSQELHAKNLLATCIQHEIDHLSGKLFIDYLSKLKVSRIRKKIEKQHSRAI
ncbi:peptide deformylase [Candidatus Nitrosacidococcus tergens]|uniref:Peptide deformylase n=1 Tax=Candidatus Nitrosacidococcus tergens TaxID=553981 RepID=A0A7G1QBC1_9GAMM|nr:peptide deformylase [Candidatus Nitrosacidococcus tergens]CAB1277296.1 peptide deformylase [Candidatus Nitrosacidococcus tergens]